ncbi:unnamed protein product [Cunninghamella echinulata]
MSLQENVAKLKLKVMISYLQREDLTLNEKLSCIERIESLIYYGPKGTKEWMLSYLDNFVDQCVGFSLTSNIKS